ncbi:hypothetical protein GCM10023169_31310 [Georgenia halophila]|uniref:Uridine kinase n=1 Tax=Georgenia halophila TaxID=620889 RepID=A0ABP8LHU2_9MICO
MAMSPQRRRLLERVARGLAERAAQAQILRVAIDGPDAAGKTKFSWDLDGLLHPLLREGAELRRFSADDLLLPPVLRRAPDPRWVYEHAYPIGRLRQIIVGDPQHERPGTVLLVDGMSLLRPELEELWDVTVYLSVSESVTMERVLARVDEDDDRDEVEARYRERYLPALELYRKIADPLGRADIVIDMTDVLDPRIERWSGL